jgi:hypothetical protein
MSRYTVVVRQALVCGIFSYAANIALYSEWVFATVLLLKCYFSIATVFPFYWGVTPKPVFVSTRKTVLLWSPNVPNCAHKITPFKSTTWANRTHVGSPSPTLRVRNIHFSVASHEYVGLGRYIFFWGFPANVLCNCLGLRWMVYDVVIYSVNITRQARYMERNIEARSCIHCCSGKTMIITYSECVFVALVIRHAHCMPDNI